MEINLSDKYQPLFDIPQHVDTFILTGGRFSAKSFTISLAACYWAAKLNHRILYTRYTNVSSKDSTIPEFEEKISMLGWDDFFNVTQGRIEANHNDSKIVFKGLKTGSSSQTANLKSLKDFSCWILEEAEELNDFNIYEKTALSIRGNPKDSEYKNLKVLILNPTTKEHWIYKHFFEERGINAGFNGVKENVCYIHTSYLDCIEHVPEEIVREFDRMKLNNPKRYNHIVLGGWLGKAEGVIFENWEIGEFDKSLPFIYGQDYGFSIDPTTLVKVAVDKKRRVIYCDEVFCKSHMGTNDIIQENKKETSNRFLIVGDSAEPRLISECKKAGLNIKGAIKGQDSVRAGILNMIDYKIVVTDRSTNLIKELNNYVWNDKKSNTPIDDYNHCIDGVRYAVSHLTMKPKRAKIKRF